MARARKTLEKSGSGASDEKLVDPKGLKKFSEEADNELSKSGDKITAKLGEQASEGSLACAKLLVELAARRVVKKRVTRRKKATASPVDQLENEPEWTGGAADEQPY